MTKKQEQKQTIPLSMILIWNNKYLLYENIKTKTNDKF